MIATLANSPAWLAETCHASCAPSRRRLLQVNPVAFKVDCARAPEDPEGVSQANKEATALEQEARVNDVLGNSLNETLPVAIIVAENISPTFISEAAIPGLEEGSNASSSPDRTATGTTQNVAPGTPRPMPSHRPVGAASTLKTTKEPLKAATRTGPGTSMACLCIAKTVRPFLVVAATVYGHIAPTH
eukprot:jgi/Picsp_1/1883/NSC_05349-R1_---NA---